MGNKNGSGFTGKPLAPLYFESKKDKGEHGERIVSEYMSNKGWTLFPSKYGRNNGIDQIYENESGTILCVEVKTNMGYYRKEIMSDIGITDRCYRMLEYNDELYTVAQKVLSAMYDGYLQKYLYHVNLNSDPVMITPYPLDAGGFYSDPEPSIPFRENGETVFVDQWRHNPVQEAGFSDPAQLMAQFLRSGQVN